MFSKVLLNFIILFSFMSCNIEIEKKPLEQEDQEKIVENLNEKKLIADSKSLIEINEDTEKIIQLPYRSSYKSMVNSCSVQNLENAFVSSPCKCDDEGKCSVGITGVLNFHGRASLEYIVEDDERNSNSALVIIDLLNKDDAPIATNIGGETFYEDNTQLIELSYFDIDGDLATSCEVQTPLEVEIVNNCSCKESGKCFVTIKGKENFHGLVGLSYRVTTRELSSNWQRVEYQINPVDDPLRITEIVKSNILEDQVGEVKVKYIDIDGPQLSVGSCEIKNHENLSLRGCSCSKTECTVSIEGNTNFNGTASFDLQIKAGKKKSPLQKITVSIGAVDDSPKIGIIQLPEVKEDEPFTTSFRYDDIDSEGAVATCVISGSYFKGVDYCRCYNKVCNAKLIGKANQSGQANLYYSVRVNSKVDNKSQSLFITAMDDRSVTVNTVHHSIFYEEIVMLDLPYRDIDSRATTCDVKELDKLVIKEPCKCVYGKCQVGVTSSLKDYNGQASFKFAVNSGGVKSNYSRMSFNWINEPLIMFNKHLYGLNSEQFYKKSNTLKIPLNSIRIGNNFFYISDFKNLSRYNSLSGKTVSLQYNFYAKNKSQNLKMIGSDKALKKLFFEISSYDSQGVKRKGLFTYSHEENIFTHLTMAFPNIVTVISNIDNKIFFTSKEKLEDEYVQIYMLDLRSNLISKAEVDGGKIKEIYLITAVKNSRYQDNLNNNTYIGIQSENAVFEYLNLRTLKKYSNKAFNRLELGKPWIFEPNKIDNKNKLEGNIIYLGYSSNSEIKYNHLNHEGGLIASETLATYEKNFVQSDAGTRSPRHEFTMLTNQNQSFSLFIVKEKDSSDKPFEITALQGYSLLDRQSVDLKRKLLGTSLDNTGYRNWASWGNKFFYTKNVGRDLDFYEFDPETNIVIKRKPSGDSLNEFFYPRDFFVVE